MVKKLPDELARKWSEAERTGEAELGELVICDSCNHDYTRDDTTSGGFIVGSYAYGPCCSERHYRELVKYGETHHVRAECPAGVSFWRFVLDYRAARGSTAIRIRPFER